MIRNGFKLVLGFGLLSLAVASVPACGGDDDNGGGGKGGATTGGTGGKGGGGTGGGGTGGSTTDGGGITCGSSTCTGWKVSGLLDVAPCCAGTAQDKCGADVDATISGVIGLPAGCYEIDQPGEEDCGCPSHTFTNPIPPPPTGQFNGCCTPDGKCGIFVDLSSRQGPKIGCQDSSALLGAKTCTAGSPQPPPDGGYCPTGDGGTSDAATD